MGAILLLASDYCLAVDNEKAKIGLNETAIGITILAVEFGRFRLPPKYFGNPFKADIYSMKQACDVSYISQLYTEQDVEEKLSAVVETYKALDMRSYRNTKMKIRKQVVESVNLDSW